MKWFVWGGIVAFVVCVGWFYEATLQLGLSVWYAIPIQLATFGAVGWALFSRNDINDGPVENCVAGIISGNLFPGALLPIEYAASGTDRSETAEYIGASSIWLLVFYFLACVGLPPSAAIAGGAIVLAMQLGLLASAPTKTEGARSR